MFSINTMLGFSTCHSSSISVEMAAISKLASLLADALGVKGIRIEARVGKGEGVKVAVGVTGVGLRLGVAVVVLVKLGVRVAVRVKVGLVI